MERDALRSAVQHLKALEPPPLSALEVDNLIGDVLAQVDAADPAGVPKRSPSWPALLAVAALLLLSFSLLREPSAPLQETATLERAPATLLMMEARPGLTVQLVSERPVLLRMPGAGEVLLRGEGALSVHSLARPELAVQSGRFRAEWRPSGAKALVFRGEQWRFAMAAGETWVHMDGGGLSFEQLSGEVHWVKRVLRAVTPPSVSPVATAPLQERGVPKKSAPQRPPSSVPSAAEMYDIVTLFLALNEGNKALEAASALQRVWPSRPETSRAQLDLAAHFTALRPAVAASLYQNLLDAPLSSVDRARLLSGLCELKPDDEVCVSPESAE